ncbi:hypothetical protein [Moorena sp. SIO3I8]|uniref:hypothetical protein n=1 Tax=Moorena sp. SIO3I8 TaxID=2607833 RepID=UPI0013C1F9B7|nr:hypothetical protein [Moorena sp. SIO3I8]NEO10501.1 hypothetical protein [Moorena sp. SIO3I8]
MVTSFLELKSSEYGALEPLSTRFTLSNNSDIPLSILKWNTPLEGFNHDMFLINKSGGESVAYTGRLVKRGVPQPDDYLTLKPGESVLVEVDLAQAYEIYESGDYSVTFKSEILDVESKTPTELAAKAQTQGLSSPKILESNTVSFKLLTSRPKSEPEALLPETSLKNDLDLKPEDILSKEINRAKQTPVFEGCSAERQNSLNQALTKAETIAEVALFDLQNTPTNKRSNAQRYKTWFGSYTQARYSKVSSNFEKIYDALAKCGLF